MKELEISRTKIGEIKGEYKGKYTIFSVFYGNHLAPMIDNEFVHLVREEYLKVLNTFLSSEEGSLYERPSDKEIKDAEIIVINSEMTYLSEKTNQPLDFEVVKLEPEEKIDEEANQRRKKYFLKLRILLSLFIILFTLAGLYFISS